MHISRMEWAQYWRVCCRVLQEWGNPAGDEESYENIRSYSPVDNVRAQAYPSMLVTGGERVPTPLLLLMLVPMPIPMLMSKCRCMSSFAIL